jgi:predicted Zn-ribbon and HTH transcriptional regulator
MKESHQCPKCKSKEIVMLASGNFMTKVYPFGKDDTGYSMVAKYACTECGYVEEYLVDQEELAEIKSKLG